MLRRLGSNTVPRLLAVQQQAMSGYSASSDQSVSIDSPDSSSRIAPLELRTGHMARFADAAVVASRGESAVLATVVTKAANGVGSGFTPLTVDFRQSAAAVGKIPTNYLRRELGQSDADILISRIIDRSLRPLIPDTVADQIQLQCKPLATEDDADPVTLAVNAASAALQISPIPMLATSAAVRVALVDGKPIVNPPRAALRDAAADLLLTGSEGGRTLMIEMDGREIPLEQLEQAMEAALNESDRVIRGIVRLADGARKEKRTASAIDHSRLDADLIELCRMQLEFVMSDARHDKISRDDAIRAILTNALPGLLSDHSDEQTIRQRYATLVKKTLRSLILNSSVRCDGRGIDDFRPISIQVDVFKKLHGSALFQRGQTQLLSTCTFDAPSAAFHPDAISQLLGSQRKKSFMLHYEFPGYATNEITVGRGSNRRELGHGALAEKGLKHLVPTDFPYALRLACQVLESNGSSSMASVCAGSMALLDAGVPMKAQAAGVAIGLVTDESNPDEKYEILTDLAGIEDYAGDMDFKMAGTTTGFTAMQLDVKSGGLTRKQLHESLVRGRSAISRLVKRQDEEIARPREQFKATVPIIESLLLETYKRGMLFKGGGIAAKLIEAETGVKISPDDDKHISLTAPNREELERAKTMVRELTSEVDETQIEFGKMITVECVALHDGGISVRINPNGKSYFVANKQLHSTPIQHPSAVGLKVGDRITMQWLGRDSTTGAVRMSRRALQGAASPAANAFKRGKL